MKLFIYAQDRDLKIGKVYGSRSSAEQERKHQPDWRFREADRLLPSQPGPPTIQIVN